MHLVLSRVQESDFDELLEVQFRAFAHVGVHTALFGPNTPEMRQLTKEKFIKDMHEDSSDCWMKLVDTATGKIVSAAQWKIYPSWAPHGEHPPFKADWFEGKEREAAEEICNKFMKIREGHMYGHAHVCMFSSLSTGVTGLEMLTRDESAIYPLHRSGCAALRRWLHTRQMGHRAC
jgi:hypothetical protein